MKQSAARAPLVWWHRVSRVAGPLALSAFWIGMAAPLRASGPVFPGDDVWGTPCGGGTYSDFSANPIPAGFFDPGSDPFTGQAVLGGNPAGILINPPPNSDIDTIVRRGGTTPGFMCGSTEVVPIEIVALSLVSCQPITVTYNNGNPPELWDVRVCLRNPQTPGTMTLNHECPDGGSYNSVLPVRVHLFFQRQLDGATRGPLPQNVTMTSSGWWSHTDPTFGLLEHLLPGTMIADACTGLVTNTINPPFPNFFPGLYNPNCTSCFGPQTPFQKLPLTPEQALLASHGVFPANQKRQSGGNGGTVVTQACCLPNNTCIDVPPLDCVNLFGGIPQGPGTNCANTICGGPVLTCPIPPTLPAWCANLQGSDCITTDPTTECLPHAVRITPPPINFSVEECACSTQGNCGPIDINGPTLSCPGICPLPPLPPEICQVFIDGNATGLPSISLGDPMLTPGSVVTCDCGPQNQPQACCQQDGACIDGVFPNDCIAIGGTPQGPGSVCQGIEACCIPTPGGAFTCQDMDALCCDDHGGTPQGAGTACQPEGACCYDADFDGLNESCQIMSPLCCDDLNGIFQGPGSVCQGTGACCFGITGGACVEVDGICCDELLGVFQGPGTVCLGDGNANGLDDACEPDDLLCPLPPPPLPALCANLQANQCVIDDPTNEFCLPRVVRVTPPPIQVIAEACDCLEPGLCGPVRVTPVPNDFNLSCDNQCPAGAGQCVVHINNLPTGMPRIMASMAPPGSSISCGCLDVPQEEACCLDNVDPPVCVMTTPLNCVDMGGTPQGPGTVCTAPEACCLPGDVTSFCIEVDPLCCDDLNGTPQGAGSSCQPEGACCYDADGDLLPEVCSVMSEVCCDELNGTFQGANTVCQGTGACCFGITGGGCVEVDGICCDDFTGVFQGPGTVCLGDGNANGLDDACEQGCNVRADCCDVDNNNIRDDNCVWCECANPPGGTCNFIDIIYADVGGSFGSCPPDGFCNLFDRNHTLTCFAGTNPCNPLNIDIGGPFGSCPPDGFCNLFDANHTLTCFNGSNPCSCPPGPAPQASAPAAGSTPAGHTGLRLVADARSVRPGDTFSVRVFTDAALKDLQGYQLHLGASGGTAGTLELVDIQTEPHASAAFNAAASFNAFNVTTAQMLHGLENGGVRTPAKAYLATYTYRVPRGAAGTFVIDVLHDEAGGDQTYLVANFRERIEITGTTPAIIEVTARGTGQ